MNKYKSFICGIIIGSFIAGGVGYASDQLQIDVKMPMVDYWLNGKEMTRDIDHRTTYVNGSALVPTTLQYKGTNYVPVRFIAEALGLEVTWDGKTGSVHMNAVESTPFRKQDLEEVPQAVQDWVKQSLPYKMGQVRSEGDHTYILLTRGEKGTGGYTIKVTDIKQYAAGTTIGIALENPVPEELVTQPITYPYDLVQVDGTLKGPYTFKTAEGTEFPGIIGLDSMPVIARQKDSLILFNPVILGDELNLQGIVNAFEGVLQYSLYDADGKLIDHKAIQATGGAPNWGIFPAEHSHDTDQFRNESRFPHDQPQGWFNDR